MSYGTLQHDFSDVSKAPLLPDGYQQQLPPSAVITTDDLDRAVDASLEDRHSPIGDASSILSDPSTRHGGGGRSVYEWYVFMKPALLLVLWTVISGMAQTLISPMVPFLLKHYYDGDVKKAASTQTIFDATRALVAAFLVPVYGRLLDTLGRRPFFIATAIVSTLPPAFLYAVPHNPLIYLFFSEVYQLFSTTYYMAYVADCYVERDRAKVLALGEGMSNLAAMIAIGTPYMSFDALVLTSIALMLVRIPMGFFLIPETLPKALRKPLTKEIFTAISPVKSIKVVLSNRVMMGVTFVMVCLLITSGGLADITQYYMQQRVNWTQDDNFHYTLEQGLVGPFILLVFYPIAAKRVQPLKLVLVAFVALIGSLVVLILLHYKWQIYGLIGPFGGGTWIGIPSLVSIFANAGDQDNQGLRMAGLAAIMDLFNALTPLVMGQLFAHLTSRLSYIPFIICLALSVPGIGMCALILPRWVKEDRREVLIRSLTSSHITIVESRSSVVGVSIGQRSAIPPAAHQLPPYEEEDD